MDRSSYPYKFWICLVVWFFCLVLRWHDWIDLHDNVTSIYPSGTKGKEAGELLPISRETLFLQQCSACKAYRVLTVNGGFSSQDWDDDDDDDDPEDHPTPSPEELEKLIGGD